MALVERRTMTSYYSVKESASCSLPLSLRNTAREQLRIAHNKGLHANVLVYLSNLVCAKFYDAMLATSYIGCNTRSRALITGHRGLKALRRAPPHFTTSSLGYRGNHSTPNSIWPALDESWSISVCFFPFNHTATWSVISWEFQWIRADSSQWRL